MAIVHTMLGITPVFPGENNTRKPQVGGVVSVKKHVAASVASTSCLPKAMTRALRNRLLSSRLLSAQFGGRRKRPGGFTLIETALALGIVAFALVPIVGLLPIGLSLSRSASDLTISAQIAQRLKGMIAQSNFSDISAPGSTLTANYFYFDGEGQPITTVVAGGAPANSVYTAGIFPVAGGNAQASLATNDSNLIFDIMVVNDPGRRLRGTIGNGLPTTVLDSHPDLKARAVIIPVYLANNGS